MALLPSCANGGPVPWDAVSAPQGTPDADERPTDDLMPDAVISRTSVFRCPPFAAIAALDAEGKPACTPTGPDGLVPSWDGQWTANHFSCPEAYRPRMLHVEAGSSDNVNFTGCFLDRSQLEGSDPDYRHPSLSTFTCPPGSVLRGFGSDGSALCRADGSVPVGYAVTPYWDGDWTGNAFTCPPGYERASQHYDCGCSNNATWPICVRTAAADEDTAAGPAGAAGAVRQTCGAGGVVTGFADDGSPVCEAAAAGLPAGAGFYPVWSGAWTANAFTCPPTEHPATLHYDCGCSNNATWYACYRP